MGVINLGVLVCALMTTTKLFEEKKCIPDKIPAKPINICKGRVASEEVTLQLIKSKCLPALLYGLEGCPLN